MDFLFYLCGMENIKLDCPYDFTSRCTMGDCDCKPKVESVEAMETKQTAVEWLVKQIENHIHHTIRIPSEYVEQAKEMEKEQSAIADVVMWLYEKHGIWINVDTLGDEKIYPKWNYKLIDLKNPNSNIEWELKQLTISYEELIKNSFNSPTEAYKAAINYTLENLIKNGQQ